MSDPHSPQIVIIGAGISGLATALALEDLFHKSGHKMPRLKLLETKQRAGGKIQTTAVDGFLCEWGVNGFLNKEPKTLELCQRLKLESKLQPASGAYKNRYIYTRGKLRSVSMHPLKFATSGLLPLSGLLRLVTEPLIKQRPSEAGDESVASFATRRIGLKAFQTLVDPMQTGIYAGDPEQMSVRSCFPRVVEIEEQYGSLIRGMIKLAKQRQDKTQPLPGAGPAGHLTSFSSGMTALIDAASAALEGKISYQTSVREILPREHGYQIYADNLSQPLDAAAVILACPAYTAAQLIAPFDDSLSQLLRTIPYPSLNVVCLGYRREQVKHRLDGFGFLAPRQAGLRILGALWMSSIFSGRAPEGHVLLNVMIGGGRDAQAYQLSDDELLAIVKKETSQVHGIEGEPVLTRIFRHQHAIPTYTLGHGERLKQIDENLGHHPGLFITGNAYRGISINDCARNAWPIAEKVFDYLSST